MPCPEASSCELDGVLRVPWPLELCQQARSAGELVGAVPNQRLMGAAG